MKDHNFLEAEGASLMTSSSNGASTISNNCAIQILPYQPSFQAEIENLVLPIQQHEFGVAITREEQPDLLNIKDTFQSNNGNFWVAISNDKVVGTIGLVDIGERAGALKKMFVHKNFRGKEHGVSKLLIDAAKQWCTEKGIRTIFLGTVSQMLAAHRFYEKNGFIEITIPQLPESFPLVHVDTKFYRCDLNSLV